MEMCLFRAIIFLVLLKKPEMWIDHGIVIKTNINMIFKTALVCKFINYFYTKLNVPLTLKELFTLFHISFLCSPP